MKYSFQDIVNLKDKIAGVYFIHNLVTDTYYIGESINIYQRLQSHYDDLWNNKHHNKNMLIDMKKYGLYNFEIEIIYTIDNNVMTNDELKNITLYLESAYYLKYKPLYNLYNSSNPLKAIEYKSIIINGYNIDFDKIKNMLDNDTYNIGYEKYKFETAQTPIIQEIMSTDQIIKYQEYVNIELIENRLNILGYKHRLVSFIIKNYRDFIISDIKKLIILLLYHIGKVDNIKSGSTDDETYFPKSPKFMNLAIIKNDTYIYQSDENKKWKGIGYINLSKSFKLSPQAQNDIYEFLKNYTESEK